MAAHDYWTTERPRRRELRSQLELAIVALSIIALIGVIADRASNVAASVEHTNMVRIENDLRAALGLRVALRVAKGKTPAAAAGLANTNPMNLLQTKPVNYLGVFENPDPATITPGHWFFNATTHQLVYIVKHTDVFTSSLNNPPRAAFIIRLRYEDANHNGHYDARTDPLYGVKFEPAAAFHWRGKKDHSGNEK